MRLALVEPRSHLRSGRIAWPQACLLLVWAAHSLPAQVSVRAEIGIPDIPGYRVLKCDFHMHTVFSDGAVWPSVRVEEAWRQGLDAIAITDHIGYNPHKDDVPVKHNRPFELARSLALSLDVILIQGAEITRELPPGHFNALFLDDNAPLDTKEWRDALKAAVDRGAFVFWNHPPFQQPEGKCMWYPEHTEILQKGWIYGIEVANGYDYYPEAHRWCLEKKLTLLASSDSHNPVQMEYDYEAGEHRPVTLVFAEERSAGGLKEALSARRTAVYWKDRLMGDAAYLTPIFEASVEILSLGVTLRGREKALLQIRNRSDVTFDLELAGTVADVSLPERLKLPRGKVALLEIGAKAEDLEGKKDLLLPYRVRNLLVAPEEGLQVKLRVPVTFVSTKKA